VKSTPPDGVGRIGTRHPRRVAVEQLAVTVRERERNQGATAIQCEKSDVSVFTCVNASGMSEFRAKRRARGSCGSNQGCCGVNVLKIEDRGWNRHPGALTRVASAAVAVKGLRFAPMNALESGAPLTAILAAAVSQL